MAKRRSWSLQPDTPQQPPLYTAHGHAAVQLPVPALPLPLLGQHAVRALRAVGADADGEDVPPLTVRPDTDTEAACETAIERNDEESESKMKRTIGQ
jgi:hypothetical protein